MWIRTLLDKFGKGYVYENQFRFGWVSKGLFWIESKVLDFYTQMIGLQFFKSV